MSLRRTASPDLPTHLPDRFIACREVWRCILVAPEGWVKFKRALLVTATKVPRELAAQIFFHLEDGGSRPAFVRDRASRLEKRKGEVEILHVPLENK